MSGGDDRPHTPGSERHLGLLRGFRLAYDGNAVSVPMGAQRLLALVALHNRPVQRCYVSGTLWAESTEENAAGSLRSALWRVRSIDDSLVESTDSSICIAPDVHIDVQALITTARGDEAAGSFAERLNALSGDLLPDWYDDWVALERERLRQLRMHALEALAIELSLASRFREALEAGHAAVRCEPLRESAQRTIVKIHIAEGNMVEARRQYDLYRTMLKRELGLPPSPQMEDLVAPIRTI